MAAKPQIAAETALKPDYRAELSRKVLHLCSAAIPVCYVFMDRVLILQILGALAAFSIVVEILRFSSPKFGVLFRRTVGFMVRRQEWSRISGATYVLAAALVTIAIYPKDTAIAVLLILSLADTAASLVGLRFGRTRFLGKSLAGSFAFFLTALGILWLVLDVSRGIAFVVAVLATLIEALPAPRLGRFDLNDNLTIPLLTGAATELLRAWLA